MSFGNQRKTGAKSLMTEYATRVGEAVMRQRAAAAEESARIQSEVTQKIRSEFLSNMSHELRTPLNTVMGFSKIIAGHGARKLKDDEIVEYGRIIHDASSHLLSVINNILDLSRIQTGRFNLDRREVDLDEILHTCFKANEPAAKEAGLTLHSSIAADLLCVRGDPAKIHQIFNNVLSNAIKFTQAGGSVTLTASNLTQGSVSVSVADTGVGMSPDEITIALTPFGQVDGSHSRWREGTGLGLPIANALAQMHEGTLNIQSSPGAGTTVTIELPSSNSLLISEARAALINHT